MDCNVICECCSTGYAAQVESSSIYVAPKYDEDHLTKEELITVEHEMKLIY